jgi:hypothetical protein
MRAKRGALHVEAGAELDDRGGRRGGGGGGATLHNVVKEKVTRLVCGFESGGNLRLRKVGGGG